MPKISNFDINWYNFICQAGVRRLGPLDLWWPGLLLYLTGVASPAYADLAGQKRPAWISPVFEIWRMTFDKSIQKDKKSWQLIIHSIVLKLNAMILHIFIRSFIIKRFVPLLCTTLLICEVDSDCRLLIAYVWRFHFIFQDILMNICITKYWTVIRLFFFCILVLLEDIIFPLIFR